MQPERKPNGKDIDPTFGTYLAFDGLMEWCCPDCGHKNCTQVAHKATFEVKCAECQAELRHQFYLKLSDE